jgi:hypothetical protein
MNIQQIRQKYPQYDDLSDAQLAAALHQKFYADMPKVEFDRKIGLLPPETSLFGQVKEFGKGIVPGAVGLVESAAIGASALLPEEQEAAARERIERIAGAARRPFAAAEGYEDTVGRKFGQAVGSTLPFLAAGPAGWLGRTAALGLGTGAGAGEARVRAEEFGATDEQRGTATALGTIPGALEIIAPFRIMGRLPDAVKADGVTRVRRALQAGGEEAAQEAASGWAQNLIAQRIYNPEQELIEGLGEDAAYGGATGALIQGVMDLALGRRARETAATDEQRAALEESVLQQEAEQERRAVAREMTGEAPLTPETDLFGQPVSRMPAAAPQLGDLYADRMALQEQIAALDRDADPTPLQERLAAIEARIQEVGAAPDRTQMGLDLDAAREYEDIVLERARLEQGEQTPEVARRLGALSRRSNELLRQGVIDRRKAARSAFSQPDQQIEMREAMDEGAPQQLPQAAEPEVREPTLRQAIAARMPTMQMPLMFDAEPASLSQEQEMTVPEGAISLEDLQGIGVPMRTSRKWFENNVVGKTRDQVQELVDADPKLLEGKGDRARVLREVLAPEVPAFQEATDATTDIRPESEIDGQSTEPGVGVPVTGVGTEPGTVDPSTAGVEPSDGAGVVPSSPDVSAEPVPEGAPAPTLTPQEQAFDDLATAVLDETSPNHTEALSILGRSENNPAFLREYDKAVRRVRGYQTQQPAPAPLPETPRGMPRRAAPVEPERFEPVGIVPEGTARGRQQMIEPMSNEEARKLLLGRQAQSLRQSREQRAAEAEAQAQPQTDPRQMELDFEQDVTPTDTERPAAAAPAPAPKKRAPRAAPKAVDSKWAEPLAAEVGGEVIPVTDDLALVRGHSALTGQAVYSAAKRGVGRTRVDVANYTGTQLSEAEKAQLLDAKTKAQAEDAKLFDKNPDGPFTKAKANVVKTDGVDQRYADYLQSLMDSMGLGNVRVFLLHPEDVKGKQAKYKLHGDYYSALSAGLDANEQGSARVYGPSRKDFYIAIKPGMSENKTIEVLAHELGHAVEKIAFKNATPETQRAIRNEFNDWLAKNKGASARDLIDSMRNRETAQEMDVPDSMQAEQLGNYWRSFDEWFADNVSRWATTAKKPVGVVEKFFSDLGKQMRRLAQLVTGKTFLPNKEVAKFLDAMGPSSADAWLATTAPEQTAPQALRASYSFDKIVESSEAYQGQPSEVQRAFTNLANAFKKAEDVTFGDRFRTLVFDTGATMEKRLNTLFDGAVRTSKGIVNPMGLYRQAQDNVKLLLTWAEDGGLVKDGATGTYYTAEKAGVPSVKEVLTDVKAFADAQGISFDAASAKISKLLEAKRLDALRKSNKNEGTEFAINKLSNKDPRSADEQIDAALREYAQTPEVAAIQGKLDKIRFDLIDNMVRVGRLTKEEAKAWKDASDYIPFERIEDFATQFSAAKRTGSGIAQLGKLPEFVGSEKREVGNVLDNFVRTSGWMIGQTLQQDATLTTVRMLEKIGRATYLGRTPRGVEAAKTVQTYVDGEKVFFELPSRWDVLAFKDMGEPKSTILRALAVPSNILRKTITSLPPFAVRQVINDIQRAFITSGVQKPHNLIVPSLRNFVSISVAEVMGKRHPSVREFGQKGIVGDYDFNTRNPMDSIIYDLGFRSRGPVRGLLHRLEGITRASDLAVRKAIYDQTLKESQDESLALTRAREFINFRRRGASSVMPALTSTIPFFNAYLQGMDVLYRAATGKGASASVAGAQARRLFYSKLTTMATFATIYAIMMSGEEEYDEMSLRVRNNNWILPGGFKLPVPEELAALFKVPVEMTLEYMRRSGTPEQMEAAEATITALKYAFEQYGGRMTPIPAAIKPVIEAWTNYSFFTGQQLEGTYQQQLLPTERIRTSTSELAKAISNFSATIVGESGAVSPIDVDNFLQGYFGSVAGMITMGTDQLLNPTRMDRPLQKYWMLSNFLYDPVGTRRLDEFYEMRERIIPQLNTLNRLALEDPDRAEKFMDENMNDLALAQGINAALRELSDTRKYKTYLNSARAAADMTQEERSEALKEVRTIEAEMVSWLREARTMLREDQ